MLRIKTYTRILPHHASQNGVSISVDEQHAGANFLEALYYSLRVDYPKFFKMDKLSKLGFLLAELTLRAEPERFVPREDVAVICFNRSSSLDTDVAFQRTIQRADSYYPSPAVFVYTLPNIATGEIAIRNKFFGETSFYITDQFDAAQMYSTVADTFADSPFTEALVAWVECFGNDFDGLMLHVKTSPDRSKGRENDFTIKRLEDYYERGIGGEP